MLRQTPTPPPERDHVHNSFSPSFGILTASVATTGGGCIRRWDESRADVATRPNALLVLAERRVDSQESYSLEDGQGKMFDATSAGFVPSLSDRPVDQCNGKSLSWMGLTRERWCCTMGLVSRLDIHMSDEFKDRYIIVTLLKTSPWHYRQYTRTP